MPVGYGCTSCLGNYALQSLHEVPGFLTDVLLELFGLFFFSSWSVYRKRCYSSCSCCCWKICSNIFMVGLWSWLLVVGLCQVDFVTRDCIYLIIRAAEENVWSTAFSWSLKMALVTCQVNCGRLSEKSWNILSLILSCQWPVLYCVETGICAMYVGWLLRMSKTCMPPVVPLPLPMYSFYHWCKNKDWFRKKLADIFDCSYHLQVSRRQFAV